MGKMIRHILKSVQDLVAGRLPWERESILLTVGKSDGFAEMKSKLKSVGSRKNASVHLRFNRVAPRRAKKMTCQYIYGSINLQVRK